MNWFTSMFHGEAGESDSISASTLNVTKIVSIFVAVFAALTQGLKAADLVPLTPGQMVTIWLVVAALIVAIGISDMWARAYVTGKRFSVGEVPLHLGTVDVDGPGMTHRPAELLGVLARGPGSLAHVKYSNGSAEETYVSLNKVHAQN